MNKLKLQRSESFYIREGWIEKFFQSYKADCCLDTFSPKTGMRILGIGSNMVKSLRYWILACQLVDSVGKEGVKISKKGKLLIDNDPYMETLFSWGLVHFWLSTNKEYAPVFYEIFNNSNIIEISKKITTEQLISLFHEQGFESPNIGSIQKDISTCISSYTYSEEEDTTPEQNINCPLSKLHLLKKVGSDNYEKNHIPYYCIDYRTLFICLRERYGKEASFNIDEALIDEGSPVLCFNMDRVTFLTLLGEMKNNQLIELNKTAGLNMAYLKSLKTDDSLFKEYLSDSKRSIFL